MDDAISTNGMLAAGQTVVIQGASSMARNKHFGKIILANA
jgi:hypothetical protein